jgi:NAD(P)-dependent dehydrogenase (short-subunit alcohol dehydrogenase family)
MNSYDLKDRVAIVTGGGQGIGLAITERLVASGASVAVWDRDQALLDGLGQKFGGTVHPVHGDIGKLDSVEAATKAVLERFGKIDILVNNAAIIGPQVSTIDHSPQDFIDVVHVGLVGTFFCCRTIVPHMIAANYGRIVNISSIAGKEGNPNAVAYSSMKAGVIALTKSLGKELATRNIAVNAITPAIAATPGAMAQTKEQIAYMLQKIPRGRMLELGEVASMVAWLASEENSFTTAAVFDLSGGRATY